MKGGTFSSILRNQRDILFVKVRMSGCQGDRRDKGVEGFSICQYDYDFICLCWYEFVFTDENIVFCLTQPLDFKDK